MIQVKTFVGEEQWSAPKLPSTEEQQQGVMGEIAHKLQTAQEHLDKQVNEWYKEHVVARDQIEASILKVMVVAGRLAFVYHIEYDDGIGSEIK